MAPAFPALSLSLLCPELRAPSAPSRRTAAPPPGCRSPWPGSRQGKFPGPGPSGRGCCRCLCGKEPGAGSLQPAYPTASSAASGDTGFPGCRSFRQPGGSGGSVRGLCGQADTLRASGRPLCAALSWEFGQGRLCTPGAFPEDTEHWVGTRCVAAGVPGALARSGKKRAVFAFANKREPELFPSGEAGGAAPCVGFPPPPSSAAARCPHAPGPLQRARGGKPRTRGTGPRGRGEVQEGMQQGSAPAKPLLAAPEQQDPRATSGGGPRELSPHLQSPRPGRAQGWGHRAAPGRPSAWAVPFVYTLEDTQLRKHRRRHAVGNGDVLGKGCSLGPEPLSQVGWARLQSPGEALPGAVKTISVTVIQEPISRAPTMDWSLC